MFKRMLSAFGVGGPSVDTVLDSPHTAPGQVVTGQVRIQGGTADAEIGQVVLSLVTRVEVDRAGRELGGAAEFQRAVVAQGLRVPAGQLVTVPFQLPIPWETPITAVGSTPLRGMSIGVRTDLLIAGAPDMGDLDPIVVHPLPSQDKVLDAFGHLGFQFRNADVEAGLLHGLRQELGFYQELEFFPPAQYTGRITEVELTFVANPHELAVVLEADKRGGLFRAGGDAFGRFTRSHQDAEATDWAPVIEEWLAQVAERGSNAAFGQHGHGNPVFGGHPQQMNPAFGAQPHGYGQPGYGYQPRRGSGVGGVVAGAAAGMLGGMMLGSAFDEIGESFDGGDEADFDV